MPASTSLHRGGSLVRCRCRDVSELVLDGAVGNAAVLVKHTRGGIEYLGSFFVEDIANPNEIIALLLEPVSTLYPY